VIGREAIAADRRRAKGKSSDARIKALAFSPLSDIMRIILIIIITFVELLLQNYE